MLEYVAELKVEVSRQENGLLDVWIIEKGEVLGHYMNARPEKVGQLVVGEIERRYGNG